MIRTFDHSDVEELARFGSIPVSTVSPTCSIPVR